MEKKQGMGCDPGSGGADQAIATAKPHPHPANDQPAGPQLPSAGKQPDKPSD